VGPAYDRNFPVPWWLGYLDTGSDDIVFPDALMVIFRENGREPGTRTIEGAAVCGTRTEDRGMRIQFHCERESMREPALIVVTLGACPDGPHTRTCRGFRWV
jgi:hypothetical protein